MIASFIFNFFSFQNNFKFSNGSHQFWSSFFSNLMFFQIILFSNILNVETQLTQSRNSVRKHFNQCMKFENMCGFCAHLRLHLINLSRDCLPREIDKKASHIVYVARQQTNSSRCPTPLYDFFHFWNGDVFSCPWRGLICQIFHWVSIFWIFEAILTYLFWTQL